MDAMTLFMVLLLGLSMPILAIGIAILIDIGVMSWTAVHEFYLDVAGVAHRLRG
jgi:hypothetical protein